MIQVNRDIYTLRGYKAGVLLRYYRTGMQKAVVPPLPPLAKGQEGKLPLPAPPVPAPLVTVTLIVQRLIIDIKPQSKGPFMLM